MAVKIMVFIDGTWLYSSQRALSATYGETFHIDYGKLPAVLGEEIKRNLGHGDIDIIRTNLFGSNAINYDSRDADLVDTRGDFFDILKEEYNYEVETYAIDYRGRRLKMKDRSPSD